MIYNNSEILVYVPITFEYTLLIAQYYVILRHITHAYSTVRTTYAMKTFLLLHRRLIAIVTLI